MTERRVLDIVRALGFSEVVCDGVVTQCAGALRAGGCSGSTVAMPGLLWFAEGDSRRFELRVLEDGSRGLAGGEFVGPYPLAALVTGRRTEAEFEIREMGGIAFSWQLNVRVRCLFGAPTLSGVMWGGAPTLARTTGNPMPPLGDVTLSILASSFSAPQGDAYTVYLIAGLGWEIRSRNGTVLDSLEASRCFTVLPGSACQEAAVTDTCDGRAQGFETAMYGAIRAAAASSAWSTLGTTTCGIGTPLLYGGTLLSLVSECHETFDGIGEWYADECSRAWAGAEVEPPDRPGPGQHAGP
jgi:hypothetical protein